MIELILLAIAIVLVSAATLDLPRASRDDPIGDRPEGKKQGQHAERRLF